MKRALVFAAVLASLGCGPPRPRPIDPPAQPAQLTIELDALTRGEVEIHIVSSDLADDDPSRVDCNGTCTVLHAGGIGFRLWATVDGVERTATWQFLRDGWPWPPQRQSRFFVTAGQSDSVVVRVDDYNLAFITRAAYSPGVMGDGQGGVPTADAVCANEAYQRNIEGKFIAFLSTSTRSAASRIPEGVRGWLTLDGSRFLDQIGDGRILATLDRGTIATGSTPWAGSASENCRDWTSVSPSDTYRSGDASEGIPGAFDVGTLGCDVPAHLLCLETARVNSPFPKQASVETTAFVTAAEYASGGGVKAFDDACAAEALAGGLKAEFRAAIATLPDSASTRFSNDRFEWARADGLLVSPGGRGFLQLTADNRVVVGDAPGWPSVPQAVVGDARVWTGASEFQNNGQNTCTDWVSTQGLGQVAFAHQQRWGSSTVSCSEKHRLFCLKR